ncbi:unnamed protein product (mitochondrion) [Plasmodiophora brassicae]|uniref:Uncharacterized protein n=1 Tax=Plasmodiophora brassicae TaxID=37360 RepID=A0A3P3Y791_PLABS|nr:unnamed protein product [Plasmodiophora brassicae]
MLLRRLRVGRCGRLARRAMASSTTDADPSTFFTSLVFLHGNQVGPKDFREVYMKTGGLKHKIKLLLPRARYDPETRTHPWQNVPVFIGGYKEGATMALHVAISCKELDIPISGVISIQPDEIPLPPPHDSQEYVPMIAFQGGPGAAITVHQAREAYENWGNVEVHDQKPTAENTVHERFSYSLLWINMKLVGLTREDMMTRFMPDPLPGLGDVQ